MKCEEFKESQKKERDTKKEKDKKGEEAHMIGSNPNVTGYQPPEEDYLLGISEGDEVMKKVMEWTHGDLSLIKGISVNGDAKNKPGVPANRRVLKHMRYDKKTGQYVPSQHKKLNRMRVQVKVDRVNLTTFREVLDHAYGE